MSDNVLTCDGVVESARGNGFFIVSVPSEIGKNEVLCQLSGKIRQNNIKIVEGDAVTIEIDPYNLTRGRIKFRKR